MVELGPSDSCLCYHWHMDLRSILALSVTPWPRGSSSSQEAAWYHISQAPPEKPPAGGMLTVVYPLGHFPPGE